RVPIYRMSSPELFPLDLNQQGRGRFRILRGLTWRGLYQRHLFRDRALADLYVLFGQAASPAQHVAFISSREIVKAVHGAAEMDPGLEQVFLRLGETVVEVARQLADLPRLLGKPLLLPDLGDGPCDGDEV